MEILVSVVCNTYNQREYIRDALEGFLLQKTNFPIEILVHDDASTDGTAQIVQEYSKKYPELIFPILQTENQYSQGVAISETFQFSRAKGRYIAFCEGDDFWTDPLKLKKQVEAMELHPDVDICAHRMTVTQNERKVGISPKRYRGTLFSTSEVIAGGGAFVSTASLMIRRSLLERPYDFMNIMSCDYVLQMAGALRGGMLYLSDCMGVYRKCAHGSWSERMKNDISSHLAWENELCVVLRALNEETNYQYTKSVEQQIARFGLSHAMITGNWRQLLRKDKRDCMAKLPRSKRIVVLMITVRRRLVNIMCTKTDKKK